MNTAQESKVVPSIFIGRWTPKLLFSRSRIFGGDLCRSQHRKNDSMNIENKTILIIGANRRFGRRLVTTVRDRGC
jgi:hypothetical protein